MMMLLFTHPRVSKLERRGKSGTLGWRQRLGHQRGANKKIKMVRHTELTFDPKEHVLQRGVAFKVIDSAYVVEVLQYLYQFHRLKNAVELVYMPFTLYFDGVQTYCEHDYTQMRTQKVTRGHKPEMSTPFLPVAMEMNLKASRIIGDCGVFTLKVIKFLSGGIPLILIKSQNILAFRLRMVVDILHVVHNV
ncbi:N-lysine methyltransferase setd6 [Pyrus ussuriensis x Pyrus communis]|uniref:N-lysine methyltransferase setd6 n=1 Tax=Pyrus ussuriensis x Pyrus communis TaxID=2448454 RepID=A0A5N5HAX1_9ROSA|nr:N-lysine methyltransferase setd6 [Pyrus ussuriensis x Pyrus communis]